MKARRPPSLFKRSKSTQYVSPENAYEYHSYKMNDVDRTFIDTLFNKGGAIHVCATPGKARYFAMRIRSIIYRLDRSIGHLYKIGLRGDKAVGWLKARFTQPSINDKLINYITDMGWVTTSTDTSTLEDEAKIQKMKRTLKLQSEDAPIFESELSIRDAILKAAEEGDDFE